MPRIHRTWLDDEGEELAAPDRSPVVAPRPTTFVPAPRRLELPPATIDLDITPVWTPSANVQEIGTPAGRAVATVIRAAPLIVLLLPITAAGAWWLGARFSEWAILWGLGSVAAYLAMLWMDLIHNSPGSVERHRVNAAAGLKRRELELTHELRRQALEAYLDTLERDR